MVAQLTLGHRPQLRIAPGVLISGQLLGQNCTKHAFPSPANVFPSNPSACTWAGCPWNFHQLKWGCNFGEAILSTCCISSQQLMMLNYICLFCRQETVCSSVDSWSAVDSYINVQSWQEKADRNGQTCVRSSCLSARYNYASSIPSLHPPSHLSILHPIFASSGPKWLGVHSNGWPAAYPQVYNYASSIQAHSSQPGLERPHI